MTDPATTTTPTAPATEPTAPNLPVAPGGIINPRATSYIAQDGTTRATLSPEQLQTARKDWLEIFDNNARSAVFTGRDLSEFSADKRTEWAAKFDLAAQQDNLAPTEPSSAEAVRHAEEHMLPPVDAKPGDYKPYYGDFLKDKGTEHLGRFNAEVTEWAAQMNFESNLGKAMIERMVEVGPRLRDMAPEDRARWLDQQEQFIQQRAGSEEAAAELKQRAKAVLSAAKGNKFAADIKDSLMLNDPWILLTLANHSRALESWAAGNPENR